MNLKRILLVMTLTVSGSLAAQAQPVLVKPSNISLKEEVQHAIDRGITWLQTNQAPAGTWSDPSQPAVTALALSAIQGNPNPPKVPPEGVKKGYAYLLTCVQPDGSIHKEKLPNYNTSLSMMALLAARQTNYDAVVRQARHWLISQQVDLGEKGKLDSPMDGGVGYGSKYPHSDMNNTLAALEALYYSRHLDQDKSPSGAGDLNWKAVVHFISSCQNLPSHNSEPWAVGDAKNKGGFIYYPGNSMAGSETNRETGRVALRSYGSISYAGLLSYLYADLRKTDPRVVAVLDWLQNNYTLTENPGMGPQGLYYYLHLLSKALSTYGADTLELKDGRRIDWRQEVALRLINLQKKDGSWSNENNRWWEKDEALVTAYSIIALEYIHRGL